MCVCVCFPVFYVNIDSEKLCCFSMISCEGNLNWFAHTRTVRARSIEKMVGAGGVKERKH